MQSFQRLKTIGYVLTEENIAKLKLIHNHILKNGLGMTIYVGNRLIEMYWKHGLLIEAEQVFDRMHDKSVVSWTSMIAAYVQQKNSKSALNLFKHMMFLDIALDKILFMTILEACNNPGFLSDGKMINALIIRDGFMADVVIGTALVNMYGKCRSVEDAKTIFGRIHEHDVVSWTSMIGTYGQNECGKEAFHLFQNMLVNRVKLNVITLVNMLEGCSSSAECKIIHAHSINIGLESNVVFGTAVIDIYAQCGCVHEAFRAFGRITKKDIVSWNTIISVCSEYMCSDVFVLFREMLQVGLKPDRVTFIAILDACACFAALDRGLYIHANIMSCRFESDVQLRTALIDMYGKCGCFKGACLEFKKMHHHDIVSWNSMIVTYAQHGYGTEAIQSLQEMRNEGLEPNETTFLHILFACSHAGLLDEGCFYLVALSRDYEIVPTLDHYGCIVDLLGRFGCLDEAEDYILEISCQLEPVLWRTLLSTCRVHDDLPRGQRTAEHIIAVDPEDVPAHVGLLSILAAMYQKTIQKTFVKSI